ncbi:MAG: acyl carrier protein [Deltaproteobacteria bacterium]|jgi:acyl carrier protein|nr:acyl carrier protein [Deltaproteobacteria bacterium]
MNNLEKYNATFIEVFGVTVEQLSDLTFQSISQWDSIGHMQLIASLEAAFEIMMDTDDLMDFNSYDRGKEIMNKYDIKI